MSSFIFFEEQNETGIIYLNRPKALNSINLSMVELFLDKLNEWKIKKTIKRVLLKGEGKAFCAGGDIKSLFFSSNESNLKMLFLRKEYTLNYAISQFNKPYMSIWNGIVMGGGVGISIYGNVRIVSQQAKFAMPETAIGFFPDVGASFFLSRLKKGIGLFLGLTGYTLNATEIFYLELATHYQENDKIPSIEKDYINKGKIPNKNIIPSQDSEILTNINLICDLFQGDLLSIMNNLKKSSLLFAQKIYSHILKRCPMSLAVTTELINKAENLSLKECLKMEYQLSQHIVYRNDFNEGVDNVLISKIQNPKWNPAKINDINFNEIKKLFNTHVKPLII